MNPCEDDEKIYNFSYLKIFKEKGKWKAAFCATKLRQDIRKGMTQTRMDEITGEYDRAKEGYARKTSEEGKFVFDKVVQYHDRINEIWKERNNQSAAGTSTTVTKLKF